MTSEVQNSFEQLVCEYFQQFSGSLNLAEPVFTADSNITTVTMRGSSGHVEMRCGPGEYHIEIFVYTDDKRWTLADLISIENVRAWLKQNRSNTAGKSRSIAEVSSAFGLLADGLKGVAGFEWLHA